MKKILIITDTFFEQMGGSHIAVSSTAHELLKRGYDVKLIFFNNGVTHKKIKLMSVISRYDIVHYFGAWNYSLIKSFIVSKILKKKFIITPMGTFEPWSLSQKKFKKLMAMYIYQKKILENTDLIHCTSDSEEKNLKMISKKINTFVISHGVKGMELEKKKLNINVKKKALFFSRIHKKKGILETLDAWNEVRPKNWEFHIVGPKGDETYDQAVNFIDKNNLKDQIFLRDPIFTQNKKKLLMKEFDISILFSKNENFGFSIIEALMHSLPVLTNHNVPWKSIKDFDAGWYIEDDKNTLVATLKKIFNSSNEELLQKGNNALKLSKNYDWDVIFPLMEKMYESKNL